MKTWKLSASLAAACALVSMPAAAQQTVDITFLSGFPPPMTSVGAFIDDYVEAVDAQLARTGNYKINWNLAHSGQVVKPRGELEGVEQGLGEISHVTTAFHFDRVPLYKVPYVTPFTVQDTGLMVEVYKMLQEKFPQFDQTWASFNQVQVGTTAVVDNYVLISDTPLKTLDDLEGKKVGAAGANLPWVTPLGVAGVQTNLAEAFNALNTGVYNAMIAWPQAMGAFKLCQPAPFTLDAKLGSASIHALNVNRDVWESWPDEVKRALTENADAWNRQALRLLEEGASKGLARCRREFGMVYTEMAPDQRRKWAASLPNLAQQWARDMAQQNLPGEAILSLYMDEMRAGDQPVIRDWDKE